MIGFKDTSLKSSKVVAKELMRLSRRAYFSPDLTPGREREQTGKALGLASLILAKKSRTAVKDKDQRALVRAAVDFLRQSGTVS